MYLFFGQLMIREGQKWTNLAKLKAHGHFANKWRKHEPGLYSFATEPKVGIGQRAFLIQTSRMFSSWTMCFFGIHISHTVFSQMFQTVEMQFKGCISTGLWECRGTCVYWSKSIITHTPFHLGFACNRKPIVLPMFQCLKLCLCALRSFLEK